MTKIEMVEGVLICPIEQYCVLAIPSVGDMVNQEKAYLIHLFIENAVRAIKNAELSKLLVQKEKLSAIGQAISMVMHDIKTPIINIQSLTEFIQEEPENADNTMEMTAMIMDSSQHAMDIIYDVRDFVQNAQLKKIPIELSTYLADIVKEVKHKPESKNVAIDLHTPEELLGQGDPKKLKRVIVNLINNAMEAMDEKGIDNPKVSLSGKQEDGYVQLVIQDNGPGIPEKIRTNLFEPFVTDGKVEGTGLGLAIVKQIIDAHSGKINVSSTEVGATFTISLPME